MTNQKAIYTPKGAAAEYAKYACNFYIGCSNQCAYCFNKRFNWGSVPKLKKCFKYESHALEVFEKELKQNLSELQKHGLFFSFTTDPMLPETIYLTGKAVFCCLFYKVPVKILTKRTDWLSYNNVFTWDINIDVYCNKSLIAFGFTLTGHDDLEPGASPNAERISAMWKLHDAGFKTWASIEPIIDIKRSKEAMCSVMSSCDLYKIGLQSGKKYNKKALKDFVEWAVSRKSAKIYFKDSLLQQAGIRREELPENCVTRDYNMFNQ